MEGKYISSIESSPFAFQNCYFFINSPLPTEDMNLLWSFVIVVDLYLEKTNFVWFAIEDVIFTHSLLKYEFSKMHHEFRKIHRKTRQLS